MKAKALLICCNLKSTCQLKVLHRFIVCLVLYAASKRSGLSHNMLLANHLLILSHPGVGAIHQQSQNLKASPIRLCIHSNHLFVPMVT